MHGLTRAVASGAIFTVLTPIREAVTFLRMDSVVIFWITFGQRLRRALASLSTVPPVCWTKPSGPGLTPRPGQATARRRLR
jgi:hypothetical protein